MKKLLLALTILLAPVSAQAGVNCSLPFNLQNGTTADATQVMANYNAITACLGNAAADGANNDITALTALTTPINLAQGGTSNYVGGTSTGTANVQAVSVSPTTFSLTAGRTVTFIAGFTNTGATTLNVASSGAVNFFRRTQLGISAMVGGEIVVGHQVTAYYDGTQYQIVSIAPAKVGEVTDYAGTSNTAPLGSAFIDGSCLVRTTYADLYTLIGTSYDPTGSTCDSAHFALPDGRGRLLAGQDNMGQGAANRITSAGSGCSGTTLGGAGCGLQNRTVDLANLPNVAFPVSGILLSDPGHSHGILDPGHAHTQNAITLFSTGANNALGGGTFPANASGSISTATSTTGISVVAATTGISIASQGSAASGGSGTALPTLPPLQVIKKIIKL